MKSSSTVASQATVFGFLQNKYASQVNKCQRHRIEQPFRSRVSLSHARLYETGSEIFEHVVIDRVFALHARLHALLSLTINWLIKAANDATTSSGDDDESIRRVFTTDSFRSGRKWPQIDSTKRRGTSMPEAPESKTHHVLKET